MPNTEIQQMILDTIEYAQSAKPLEFHLLSTWTEYKFFTAKRKSFKLLIKALQSSADLIFKNYCKSITADSADFNNLLIYQLILQTIVFYKQELATITEMIYEYEAYLLEGNYLWAFFGEPRAEEDLRDFRD